jgi:hypothetical protein
MFAESNGSSVAREKIMRTVLAIGMIIMRTILAIGMILGFIVVLTVGLLSVFDDLLVRTPYPAPTPIDDNEESGQSVNGDATAASP